MGKHKRQRLTGAPHKLKPHKSNPTSKAQHQKPGAPKQKQNQKSKVHTQAQHTAPTIPFSGDDRILLVGEGDLSFARALVEHHGCTLVIATVLEEDLEALREKYPHVGENVEAIEEKGGTVRYGVDATKMPPWFDKEKNSGGERVGGVDRIVFNFPHVGGKSTDVNRQVRYNQELLVSFFKSALPSLAPGGTIIVTLFEGEPYTLWNIRDLGRHSGLQVERSFKFQASAYPGYHHARTLGVVRNKKGEIGAGWKGEDRQARSYIFIRKGDQAPQISSKRARDDSSSDYDDIDD